MTSEHAFTIRTGFLGRIERTYRLGPMALEWSDRNGNGELAYADIARLSLYVMRSRNGTELRCDIRPRAGRRHRLYWRAYGKQAPHAGYRAYRAFVGELVRRVAAFSPEARLVGGSAGEFYGGVAVGVLWVLFTLATLWLMVSGIPLDFRIAIALVLVVTIGMQTWSLLRNGPPKRLDPAEPLPVKYLGPEPDEPGEKS